MKSFTINLLGLVLLLSGCEKFTPVTRVSGVVQDRHTRQPVAGALVGAASPGSGLAGAGASSGKSTTTDGQGRFSFSFDAGNTHSYQVGVVTASGYTNQGNGPLLNPGERNDNLVVFADAPAWVHVNYVDDPPFGKASIYVNGFRDSMVRGLSIGPGNSNGSTYEIFSYSDSPLMWRIIDQNAQLINGQQVCNTAGFDTTTVTIHF